LRSAGGSTAAAPNRPVVTVRLTRRDLLRAGAGAAALATVPGLRGAALAKQVPRPTRAGALSDIQHVVIFMQENRSFDHYFGTYPAVRGFGDRGALPGIFRQADSVAPGGVLQPFHLDTATTPAECTPDITHSYGDQHTAWNAGAMDRWGEAHKGDDDRTYFGYYTRGDLPYYYAVADEFTICDAYHCSVMGSTTSNRVYALTGMLDPDGRYGGPVLSTRKSTDAVPSGSRSTWGVFSDEWLTYPELLTDAGVSWKSYGTPDGDFEDNPLHLFEQYYPQNYAADPARAARSATLRANLSARWPDDFLRDAAAGTLPSVSWITASAVQSEHPSFAPHDGEVALSVAVDALTASPQWPSTAMFYTYDENGGYFDHVPPPTAPAGTPGEYAAGLPIGLGFRVPMLIVSPFSKGGFVCRDRFDHTSLLRFLEARFGVGVPNLTAWRRGVVGDLTTAFNFVAPDLTAAHLTQPVPDTVVRHPECATEEASPTPYPTPTAQGAPKQERGHRRSPSGPAVVST
jgi:phospholipase C